MNKNYQQVKNWREQHPNYSKFKMREYRAKNKREKKYWRSLATREIEKSELEKDIYYWGIRVLGTLIIIGIIILILL